MGKASRRKKSKPRETSIVIDLGDRPVEMTQVACSSDGKITFSSAKGKETPSLAWVETTYSRDRKAPKVVHRMPVPQDDLTINPNDALARYTWIVAVDTNNPIADLRHVFFCGVLQTKVIRETPNSFRIRIFREMVIEFHNPKLAPERVGWGLLCSSVKNLPYDARVGVIVDSELTALPAINAREQPLAGDLFLPENFHLLYASDKGDYVANRLIRICDRNARIVAKLASSGREPPLIEASPLNPFTHIRTWEAPFAN